MNLRGTDLRGIDWKGTIRKAAVTGGILLSVSLFLSGAGFDSFPGEEADPVTFEVKTDRDAVRPGESFRVAVILNIVEGWHAYANPKGPGTGKPTEVTGKDGNGFKFGPARYLPGEREDQEDIAPGDWVYAYKGKVPVFLEVTCDESVKPGSYRLEVVVDALVCKESCLPILQTVPFTIKVVPPGAAVKKINEEIFKEYDKAKPAGERTLEKSETEEGETEEDIAFDFVRYKPRELGTGGGVHGLLMALLFGFLAGIILNVMPCVLPVLSIKVMSLVSQAHEDRWRVFRLGVAFCLGILLVFLVLAALAAGMEKGWGQHFQNETFLVVMIGIVFVFALGLFDIYIILVPGGGGAEGTREGYVGSFFKGVLTTFLATPCSGPFLGATLAWALTQPAATIFTVFTSIGLGMATPYFLLSLSPGLLKFVPKPGPWMETFKHIMGFLLLGTVVYLFTILRHELVGPTLALCLVLAFAAYLWGRFAHGAVPSGKRWARRAVFVLLVAASAWFLYKPVKKIPWEKFSLARLAEYQAEGKAENVLIKFTADWCPNCKFVEKFVLESSRVLEALRAKGVKLIVADITHASSKSPAMKLLRRLGSRSIPFLAIFPADSPYEPYVLRDIYTPSEVIAILEKCPDRPGRAEEREP